MQTTATDDYRWTDLRDFKPCLADNLAGRGFFRRGCGTLITGSTGIGKSVLVEQMAVCLACGLDILDSITVPKKCKVLVIEAENDQQTLHEDFTSIATHLRVKESDLQKNLRVVRAVSVGGESFGDWVDWKIGELKFTPDVVMVDPYQSYIGGTDINSSEAFLKWKDGVDRVLTSRRLAVGLAAHTPKPQERKGWTEYDSVYLAAGTSALANWTRASCELIVDDAGAGRFCLRFGKNPKRAGIIDGNRVVREVYIQHSGDPDMPYWELCGEQYRTKKLTTVDVIRNVRSNYPHYSQADVAKTIKKSERTVRRYWEESKPE